MTDESLRDASRRNAQSSRPPRSMMSSTAAALKPKPDCICRCSIRFLQPCGNVHIISYFQPKRAPNSRMGASPIFKEILYRPVMPRPSMRQQSLARPARTPHSARFAARLRIPPARTSLRDSPSAHGHCPASPLLWPRPTTAFAFATRSPPEFPC